MKTLDEQNKLIEIYQEEWSKWKFKALKQRRTLEKKRAQKKRWEEEITVLQQRMKEGLEACQVLSESHPYHQKLLMDARKCEIRILTLQIRLQKLDPMALIIQETKLLAIESTVAYYGQLIEDIIIDNLYDKMVAIDHNQDNFSTNVIAGLSSDSMIELLPLRAAG